MASVTSGLSSSFNAERMRVAFSLAFEGEAGRSQRDRRPLAEGRSSPDRTRARPALEHRARGRACSQRCGGHPRHHPLPRLQAGGPLVRPRRIHPALRRHPGRGKSSRRPNSVKAGPFASRWARSNARSPPVSRLRDAEDSSSNPAFFQSASPSIGPTAMSLARR